MAASLPRLVCTRRAASLRRRAGRVFRRASAHRAPVAVRAMLGQGASRRLTHPLPPRGQACAPLPQPGPHAPAFGSAPPFYAAGRAF